ncbi:hypothetical protein IF721_13555 (plasmid) [Staphylococcus aureus]|uniref:hypothetical protein n=1 Tax=Staphylococcus aureus TaxID=1280 RepID=UPI000BA7B68F|nr:hypothetical protein [Staphylococcus aureus]EHS7180684.1 hypothetical protein [Staphylococcus pseudintermedius]PAJ49891.1 hypothetical protein APW25_12045 [Staphylococcus aureus]ULW18152.1 hypothetical protein IF721_13555 [Staphylococcus aureus]HAR6425141.1 hypothetical protein [Staphylococcus pseudintermedius]
MKFDELKDVLNAPSTLYSEEGGVNMAVNAEKGLYVKESNDVYVIGELNDQNISNHTEATELYNLQQVGEILNLTRAGVRWALDNKDYRKVPKPLFVNETKRGNTYFWLPQQFKKDE